MYQTLKAVFDYLSKYRRVRLKHSDEGRIFNSSSLLKFGQAQSFLFDHDVLFKAMILLLKNFPFFL